MKTKAPRKSLKIKEKDFKEETKNLRKNVAILKKADKMIDSLYTATLKIFGKKYSASGSTKIEAIANLNVTNVAKGMSVLTLSKGKVSKDRLLPPRLTARLFASSRLMKEVAVKQVSSLFEI